VQSSAIMKKALISVFHKKIDFVIPEVFYRESIA